MSAAAGMRTDYCGELGEVDVGRQVRLCGWVARRREHGEHLAFVDLRDHTGLIQCVVDGAHDLRSEYVVAVEGTVRVRPEGTANPSMPTGQVEVGDCSVQILSVAEAPPVPVGTAAGGRPEADESVRLRYRYIDLRSDWMQSNLRIRAKMNSAIRSSMERQGFVEVETPLLWTPTPEGAREFAVPSRRQPGTFYVLPQSPQIAKQLLMVGGLDRYYQMARCMRDEDVRADRQFEFTQLDMEASFVDAGDVMGFVSEAVLDAAEAVTGERPGCIEVMSWDDALDRYGTDKPDLRFGMELVDLKPVLADTELRALQADCVRAICLAGQADIGRSRLDALRDRAQALGAAGLVWLKVIEGEGGHDLDSPVARFLSEEDKAGIVKAAGAGPGDLLLVVAGDRKLTCRVLGQLRIELGRPPPSLGPHGPYRYVWIVDFPMFESLDETGRPVPAHHPFTMPHEEDLDLIDNDPLSVRSKTYDLVLNGWELGSGSIRIHRGDVQSRVFSALGMSAETAEERFGFLLNAFRYGVPPHGGFAFGTDRLAAIFAGQENIREVIAFPKTQSGVDPMTGAPKVLPEESLKELGIRLR